MKTITIDTINAQFARESQENARKLAVLPLLPVPPRQLSANGGKHPTISVVYEAKGLPDALAIYSQLSPLVVACEAWKSGCLSIAPREINGYATEDGANPDFVSYASLKLHSYADNKYQDAELDFYGRAGGEWLHFTIKFEASPFGRVASFIPAGKAKDNDYTGYWRMTWPQIGADNVTNWWSEKPCYSRSYHWKDAARFAAWLGKEAAK